jgi:hypothetical protein
MPTPALVAAAGRSPHASQAWRIDRARDRRHRLRLGELMAREAFLLVSSWNPSGRGGRERNAVLARSVDAHAACGEAPRPGLCHALP